MMRWLSFFPMLLSVLLMGCSVQSTAQSPTANPTNTQTPASLGQTLPISAQATVPNGTKIELEVARTPEQQQLGLMYRPALPDNRGMLFELPSAQSVRFWMKNVPVALDMVFLHNGVVRYIQTAAPPCPNEPCPTYGTDVPIDQVIELRAGRAQELSLKKGDSIKIEFLNTKDLP
ncbi:DUF192 domain-containing protein [Aliinostoc sp. HNIBRCY26]|uniref:DUF192 domain-containing protein n=1 Tax=Aliinostoc sp. HNIBRCY26 TaxID=3418997 RepID=UPI003D06CCDF